VARRVNRAAVLLALRPFEPRDDGEVISWFETADELRRFAGSSLRWPLDARQLQAVRDGPNLSAFSAYLPPERFPALGHIEVVRLPEPGVVRIARVGLAPQVRGQGLGRELVSLALNEARRWRAHHVDLFVFEDNEPARRLYDSFGFRQIGVDPTDPTSLRMNLKLPR
jgi:ribosomal protein S18 acetylase RimI-like enzyme